MFNLFGVVIGQPFNLSEAIIFVLGKSTDILVLLFASLIIRLVLELAGQTWIKTFSQTVTIFLLPIITYIITSVISGNIALSLGMVGALSIVRFRNPVRSPLELSVYFAAISMGITTSVSLNWFLFFLISIFAIYLFLLIFSFIYSKVFKTSMFKTSFAEGNSLSTLEVKSKVNISILDKSSFLKSKTVAKDLITYILGSSNFESLKRLSQEVENSFPYLEYELNE